MLLMALFSKAWLSSQALRKEVTKPNLLIRSNSLVSIQFSFLQSIHPLFFVIDQLDKYQKLKLVDGLQTVSLVKDQFVLKEGEEGQEFYIID